MYSKFPGAAALLVALPFFFIITLICQDTSFIVTMNAITDLARAKLSQGQTVDRPIHSHAAENVGNGSSESISTSNRLLDGLLSPNFDEKSCLSRYQSESYRKPSPFKPSPYLVSKLQSYEERHRRCAPNTDSYKRSVELLKKGQADVDAECKYVIWVASHGLGNRILSMVGSFLYALLTDRVLLINQGNDMADLFCEPFPDSSWILPKDFPSKNEHEHIIQQRNPHTYGNMLRNNKINASTESLPYLYIYLHHDSTHHDMLLFCDEYQPFLRKVPWLMFKSNLYFAPSMFLMDSFESELSKLFPDKETVFYHLGRYLLHPSNRVWSIVSKYFQENLAKAEEKIGIQVRIFNTQASPIQNVTEQVLNCVQKEKLLPEVDTSKNVSADSSQKTRVSKAVLIASLYGDCYEKMKRMYLEHETKNGEVVRVYQPSHEEQQKYGNNLHNIQAWVEMYLLSYSDVLVASARSTFGYVAHSLGGKRPYLLYMIGDKRVPEPACRREISMEPCFLTPPRWDCKKKSKADIGTIVPHIRKCEDTSSGLRGVKLFNTFQ